MSFNWKSLVQELVSLAPSVVQDVETDNANASNQTKTQLATQALVQASTVAQSVDPNDTTTIQGVTAVAGGIITALKTPSPVPAAAAAQSGTP
ncbi:MAG: hypothetical protein WCC25_16135 [Candidatus Korobacteraceae bacterium]